MNENMCNSLQGGIEGKHLKPNKKAWGRRGKKTRPLFLGEGRRGVCLGRKRGRYNKSRRRNKTLFLRETVHCANL